MDSGGSQKSRSVEHERSSVSQAQLAKQAEYEEERRRREYELERERERKKERERAYERAKEKEKERERYERERFEREERERKRERDRERERERERAEREYHARHRAEREERAAENYRERERSADEEPRSRAEEKSAKRDFSPIPENGAGDCLSIEETNKLRAKLGLKPLEMDSGPSMPSTSADTGKAPGQKDLASYKDEWGEFLHKPADNLKEKAKAEKLREKLKQRKEKRFLEERLARIKTLGESDEEVDDVSKWVVRNKKAVDERKEAEKRVM